jgi:Ca2+ insensitive EF hand
MDLRHSLIPDDLIEDLLHSMPKHTGPDLEVDRQVPKYDYIGFMSRMAGGEDPPPSDGRENRTTSVVNGGAGQSPRKENMRPTNGSGGK